MSYPVLPPEQPPIVQLVTPNQSAIGQQPEISTVDQNAIQANSIFQSKQQLLHKLTAPTTEELNGVSSHFLASPSKPETFKPERSNPSQATAATLGDPLTVGLPLAPGERMSIADTRVIEPNKPAFYGFISQVRPTKPRAQAVAPSTIANLKELTLVPVTPNPTAQVFTNAQNPPQSDLSLKILGAIELTADQQTYDSENQVFTAEGNVAMRFRGALLKADRLQVNLNNRLAVAEGNVSLTRGQQVLRGNRFEYNFVLGTGVILQARGEVYSRTAETDFAVPSLESETTLPSGTVSDRIISNQPSRQVTSADGITGTIGAGENAPDSRFQGTLQRIRYEADRIDFTTTGWVAQNVRLTNDPFSPPELEVRASQAEYQPTGPDEGVIETTDPRLVFDQNVSIPILQSRAVIGRRQPDSGLFQIGYDGTDRGGLFIEKTFQVLSSRTLQFTVTPQLLVQRMARSGNVLSPDAYGLRSELNFILGSDLVFRGNVNFASLDLAQAETKLRASIRLTQIVASHSLSLEYSYRDRLFNGSLGFQDVQSNLGAVLASPTYEIGQTGILLTYQASAQYINADTDRVALLPVLRTNNRIFLGRFQASTDLTKRFYLWEGKGLPATPDAGLRYTPSPVVPYLQIATNLRGVVSAYTNGETQQTLTGTISLLGQFGHFSRPFLDYTAFNIGYSETAFAGLSPFLFDRAVDTRVLTGGFTQQIYGPLRFGIQTAINLNTGKEISTDYILEYSRRTYGVTLRYNPVLQLGALGLRISDFNWTGGSEPFAGSGVRAVRDGVIEGR